MNGRKARALNRSRRERNEQWLAEARAVPAVLMEAHETFELWQRGRFTFALPVILDDLPGEMKDALAVYRGAALDGRCPGCRVASRVSRKGLMTTHHESGCVAHPDRLVELGERLGVDIERTS
ncbi:hypothetical protein ABTX35_11980 [Streptomyces sp. NPDC096080]|uniref:hypothetical protein n=1 Tax=Streptomyces sp. NPDC096080 TaxID=3156693 RepID=UPI00332BF525